MRRLLLTLIALLSVYVAGAQCTPGFTTAAAPGNPLQITLTNTSTVNLVPGSTPMFWIAWGDNNTSVVALNGSATHTYANYSSYLITLYMTYYDTLNNQPICNTTDSQMITIYSPCASSITSVDNGGGSFTFTANNLGGGTGLTYNWNFGDGGTGTGSSVNHTYTASGNYYVSLATSGSGCVDSSFTYVQYFNGVVNCAGLSASFSASSSGYTASFTNTSTYIYIPGAALNSDARWDFGDGSAIVTGNNSPSHTYAATGTYTVTMINDWVDTFTHIVYCSDTAVQQVTITSPPNFIAGSIYWDSITTSLGQVSFKVWLIVMDSAANTLTAVDSALTSGYSVAPYAFYGHPAGIYRTKAAVLSGTPGATSLIPTYHDTSAYWNTAMLINHTGGSTIYKDIHMKSGTWSGGPGFIGGNISLGANKGTSGGVPGILVMLRGTNNQLMRFTYTDANGDYSFGGIPAGTYNVYPEHMNYITIPSSPINLVSGQYYAGGVNFKHTPTHIKPIPAVIGNLPESDLFNIYPNPSNGNVQINWLSGSTGKADVHVVDMTGRRILNQEVQMSQSVNVDLSYLQAGVYFIRISTDKAQHSERIIIQH